MSKKKTLLLVIFVFIIDYQFNGQAYTFLENFEPKLNYAISSDFYSNEINDTHSGLHEQISDSLIIPLKRAGNLLIIETEIDGIRGNLIFDSGAAALLVLNETYFRNYKKIGSKYSSGINGNIQEVGVIRIDSFQVSKHIFFNIQADVTDLSHIENKKGVKILGFFGLELVNDFEIVIDVKNDELKLVRIPLKKNKPYNISYNYEYSQEIEIVNNVIFLWATVGGKDLRFCMDTGAEKNVISHSLPQKVMNSFTFTGRVNLSGAGSTKREVLCGVINDFLLGPKSIKNMTAIFTDLSGLSEVYGVQISGVLGYEFLTIGKIYVNCNRKLLGIDYN